MYLPMENQKSWGALAHEVAGEMFPSMSNDVPKFIALAAVAGASYIALMPALLFLA